VGEVTPAVSPTAPWLFGKTLALTQARIVNEPRAGGVVEMQLDWQSQARTPNAYTVFVHIVDSAGDQVGGKDAPPLDGFAATNLLLPGQAFTDTISIPLDAALPAGEYSVRLGLYDANGRLPVAREGATVGDFAEPATFTVR
jgi:hypothetical protein